MDPMVLFWNKCIQRWILLSYNMQQWSQEPFGLGCLHVICAIILKFLLYFYIYECKREGSFLHENNSDLGSSLVLVFNFGRSLSFSLPQFSHTNNGDICFPNYCLGLCQEKHMVILHQKMPSNNWVTPLSKHWNRCSFIK